MFTEFDIYVVKTAGALGAGWDEWVTKELLHIGKVLAVIKEKVLHENP